MNNVFKRLGCACLGLFLWSDCPRDFLNELSLSSEPDNPTMEFDYFWAQQEEHWRSTGTNSARGPQLVIKKVNNKLVVLSLSEGYFLFITKREITKAVLINPAKIKRETTLLYSKISNKS